MSDAQPDPDPKRAAILAAAIRGFAAYGFRRTSMEDISRGAGMSRPALYLHFDNKEAILRALVAEYYADVARDVAAALAQPGAPEAVLTRAFAAQAGEMAELLIASPHGELLSTSHALSADLSAEGEARLARLYAGWLARGVTSGALRLAAPPEMVADAMLAALKGAKVPPFSAYSARLKVLAQMFGRGMTATRG